MSGTANAPYDHDTDLSNIDLFSAWLFGKINANCLLSDLSQRGCSVLIPKNQSIPCDIFNLLIMSPGNSDQLHTIVKAEQRWENKNHSSTHSKIGIKFRNLEHDQLLEIRLLEKYFNTLGNVCIKCSSLQP